MATRLSVVIITCNVQSLLADCLACVRWADEILVLDSGSKDHTLEIARAAGAKVFINTDWQGYGIQRQRAQQLASGDYILMLDADERVTPPLADAIRQVLANPQANTVYSLARRNLFLGRWMRHSGWYPDRVVRLYPREHYRYNDNLVHESLNSGSARVHALSGDLQHLTCRDFIGFQQKQLAYARDWAQQQHSRGRRIRLPGIFIRTAAAFSKTLLLRAGLLDGKQGWLLAVVNAQYTFNKYTALWALNQSAVANPPRQSLSQSPSKPPSCNR